MNFSQTCKLKLTESHNLGWHCFLTCHLDEKVDLVGSVAIVEGLMEALISTLVNKSLYYYCTSGK